MSARFRCQLLTTAVLTICSLQNATLAVESAARSPTRRAPAAAVSATLTDEDVKWTSVGDPEVNVDGNQAASTRVGSADEPKKCDAPDVCCDRAAGGSCCPPTNLWWFGADYRLVWTNGNPVPALVTTNLTVPPRPQAGVLGVGDTEIVLTGVALLGVALPTCWQCLRCGRSLPARD